MINKYKALFRKIIIILNLFVFFFSIIKIAAYYFEYKNASAKYLIVKKYYRSDETSDPNVNDRTSSDLDNSQNRIDHKELEKHYSDEITSTLGEVNDTFAGASSISIDALNDLQECDEFDKDGFELSSRSSSSNFKSNELVDNVENIGNIRIEDSKGTKVDTRFLELLKINTDIAGWLTIPDTNVDYPVVQGQDNDFYLNHDFEKKNSRYGSIFMDFRNNIEELDKNTVLYGHHMKDGMMFNNVTKYKNKMFFENHPVITFNTIYQDLKWEVFSAYVTDVEFNYIKVSYESDSDFIEFLNTIQSKSMYKKDFQFSSADKILSLSTCSYEFSNARFVVHARLIKIPSD